MKIHGFQKMTLLDFPGKVACTVFTAGCNFRCPFCHNAPLVTEITPEDERNADDILAYLEKRKGLLDGVCITGGEPLLQPDIADFIRRIKEMGYAVKLDTNGTFPEPLKALATAGLIDYVAMDIKNTKEKYAAAIAADASYLDAVEQSVAFLLEGHVDYEFRTTVVDELHTVEDIERIGTWIRGAKRYFLQAFVDSGDLVGRETYHAPSDEKIKAMQVAAQKTLNIVSVRGIS